MKAYFLQRIGAYFIDTLVIGVISVLFTFWIPISKSYDAAFQSLKDTTEQYINNEISESTYIALSNEYNYVIKKVSFIIDLVQLIIIVGYFGTYSYYKDGKTLGKKVMKIKISSNNNNSLNHVLLILRSLFVHGVLINSLSMILLLILHKNDYLLMDNIFNVIQSIFVIFSLFLIIFRKDGRGLHDLIAKTKVVIDK